MPELPSRSDLGQLRRQAKDLLRAARRGDESAVARIRAVSERLTLSAAQLALAREYGFASWPRLASEVERREILDTGDVLGHEPDGRVRLAVSVDTWLFNEMAALDSDLEDREPEPDEDDDPA